MVEVGRKAGKEVGWAVEVGRKAGKEVGWAVEVGRKATSATHEPPEVQDDSNNSSNQQRHASQRRRHDDTRPAGGWNTHRVLVTACFLLSLVQLVGLSGCRQYASP